MASVPFVIRCSLLLLALCLVVEARLGCTNGGYGCMINQTAPPAKSGGSEMSNGMKEKEVVLTGLRPSDPGNTEDLVNWDLRWVPSGPDPLHHNGTPRKPRTP